MIIIFMIIIFMIIIFMIIIFMIKTFAFFGIKDYPCKRKQEEMGHGLRG